MQMVMYLNVATNRWYILVRPTKVLFQENDILKSPILRTCKSVKNRKTGFCQANHIFQVQVNVYFYNLLQKRENGEE